MCLPVWQIQAESDHKIKKSAKVQVKVSLSDFNIKPDQFGCRLAGSQNMFFLLVNHKISKEPLTNHYRTPLVLQLKAAKYGFYK